MDVFNEFIKNNNNSKLILVGNGPNYDKVKSKIKSYGISEKVEMLGVRSDIFKLMQGMDLFLMPSIYEGLGIVLIEAQASGLPCLVSKGIPQESDINGISREDINNNISIWCDDIEKIIKSKHKNRHTGAERARENGFDINNESKKLMNYYIDAYNKNVGNKTLNN